MGEVAQVILKKDVRPEILQQPCESCGERLDPSADCMLSFYRGRFIVVHNECSEFLSTATRALRPAKAENTPTIHSGPGFKHRL
jgi:hypothetical protein